MRTTFTGLTLALLAASPALAQTGWEVPGDEPGRVERRDAHGHAALVELPTDPDATPVLGAPSLGTWDPLGPFGGDVADVGASPTNPNIVLAALAPSSGGGTLFRSTDGGATWTEVASFSGTDCNDLEFDSAGDVYVAAIDGLYKSTDDGATFFQLPYGIALTSPTTVEVTIDPNDDDRVWVGLVGDFVGQAINVLLSTDGGGSFSNVTPMPSPVLDCTAIALNPSNSMEVWAGFQGAFGGGATYVSTDGGATWTDRSAGLPGTPVNDLAHDGSRVLVTGGLLFGGQDFGLFQSTNLGATWTSLSGSFPIQVFQDIEIDPSDATHILLASVGRGVAESTDGGASFTFSAGGSGQLSTNEVSVSPAATSTIFAGFSSAAVWRSTNGGATYSPSSAGIGALNVVSIAANPLDPDELAIAFQGLNDGGVYTSTDGGTLWSLEAVPGTRWNTVQFAPDGTLYAISDGPTTIAAEGVYVRDGGGSWTSIGPDQGTVFESELYPLLFSQNDPDLILCGGNDFGQAGFEPTVWRSTDGGANWTKAYEGVSPAQDSESVRDLIWVEDGTDTVAVGAYQDLSSPQEGGVVRSTDGGVSWGDSSTGLAVGAQCRSLDAEPGSPSTLLVADDDTGVGNGGLFRSTDGGATWTSTGYVGSVNRVVADPVDPQRIYIATFQAPRVRLSTDGGATFSAFDTGLPAGAFTRDLARAEGTNTYLLYATNGGSYTRDGSASEIETFCAGDGTAAPCPCGNTGDAGHGCENSFSTGGAELTAFGSPTIASDTLTLVGSGLPPTPPGLFFQGTAQQNGGLGSSFGDGLRCVAGTVIRLGTRTASGGVVSFGAANGGDPLISAQGQVPGPGAVRYYQLWYRNNQVFCTAAGFNLTNALTVVWL